VKKTADLFGGLFFRLHQVQRRQRVTGRYMRERA